MTSCGELVRESSSRMLEKQRFVNIGKVADHKNAGERFMYRHGVVELLETQF